MMMTTATLVIIIIMIIKIIIDRYKYAYGKVPCGKETKI